MGKFGNTNTMAKSKNHTSHNQGFKNHRNGIKKVRYQKYDSNAMVNQKLIRNNRRSRKFDPSIKKSANFTKKIAARKAIKQQVLEKLKAAKVAKALGTNKKGKKD